MLLGKARMLAALQKAAGASPADETLLAAERSGFTTLRFANERIHQNFQEEDVTVWVKVAAHGRVGVSTTCSLNHDALVRAVESAITIAKVAAKQSAPAFSTRPPKEPAPALETHFPATVSRPLPSIIEMIQRLWKKSRDQKMELAGSFVRGEEELAVAGSGGLAQYQPFTSAGLRLVPTRDKSSGFASQAVRDLDRLDPEALAERAWNFCRMNNDPRPIRLGKYPVLLEPEAVAELLEWLGYIGFGAKQVAERTSFMAGRTGTRVMGPKATIVDDGSDPGGMAVPFDFEGVPKRRLTLIEKGKASGIVYDSHFAKLHHRESTGHAGPYDQFEGPVPSNLFFAAGETPAREMLKKLGGGLWITRFHYVSGLLNTKEALMTGLTRDGTFLVRGGKVVGAVKNLRFTQSVLEAFSKIVAASRERRLIADPSQGLSAVVAPALLIRDFTFTGQTK